MKQCGLTSLKSGREHFSCPQARLKTSLHGDSFLPDWCLSALSPLPLHLAHQDTSSSTPTPTLCIDRGACGLSETPWDKSFWKGDFLTKFRLSHTGQQLRQWELSRTLSPHSSPRRSPEASSQHLSGQWAEARLSTYWPCRQTVKWDTSSLHPRTREWDRKKEKPGETTKPSYTENSQQREPLIFQNPEKKKNVRYAPFPRYTKQTQRPCREYRIWPQASRMRRQAELCGIRKHFKGRKRAERNLSWTEKNLCDKASKQHYELNLKGSLQNVERMQHTIIKRKTSYKDDR